MIYEYALGEASVLSPSDQDEVLKRLYGIRVPLGDARAIVSRLDNLNTSDTDEQVNVLDTLLDYPYMYEFVIDWVKNHNDTLTLFVERVASSETHYALDVLERLGVNLLDGEYEDNDPRSFSPEAGAPYDPPYVERLIRTAYRQGYVDVLERLYQLYPENYLFVSPIGHDFARGNDMYYNPVLTPWLLTHPDLALTVLFETRSIHLGVELYAIIPGEIRGEIRDVDFQEALFSRYGTEALVPLSRAVQLDQDMTSYIIERTNPSDAEIGAVLNQAVDDVRVLLEEYLRS